jgi:hypothetical protein
MFRRSFHWLVILLTFMLAAACQPATPAVAPAAAPTLAPTETAAPTAEPAATAVPAPAGPNGQVLWNGAPVAGAQLKLSQPGACRDAAQDTVIAITTADAEGKFAFGQAPAGEAQLCVAWPAGTGGTWSPVPLEAGAPLQNVTVKLVKPMQLLSPDLTSPVAVTPTVRWETVPDITDYRLLIINTGTTELMSDVTVKSDSLALAQPLKPGQTYQLLVQGMNASGELLAEYSGEFKTAGAAVAPQDEPVVQLPANCYRAGLPTYVDQAARICFAYPQGFTMKTGPNGGEIIGPAAGEGPEPLFASLSVEVVPYQGQDLGPYVDELLKTVPEGFPVKVERRQVTLGGHAAEVLEPMPGRLSSRQVVVDFAPQSLFVLTFWPSFADVQPGQLNAESKQVQQDVNTLYETVMDSFATLPPAGVPIDPVSAVEVQARCLVNGQPLYINADHGCSTGPAQKAAGDGLSKAEYQGVSFSYPATLATDVKGQAVPAQPAGSDAPWWLPVPEYTQLALVGYPLTGTTQQPQVVVFPADEFAKTNAEAATRIDALRKLLQDQPANPEGQMSFLPLENAAQQMHTKVQYEPFVGGQGVRYLTQYAQAPLPLNNQDLFYTYQGLTDDGKYYVAAILPVSHKSLPASVNAVPQDQQKALTENFAQYMNDAVKALDGQPDASFQPSLADLDAMVKTIAVQGAPQAAAGMQEAASSGVSFSYPASLAKGVKGETVPAEAAGSDGPWWLPVPGYTRLTLEGYVSMGKTDQEPRVVVYPADEFAKSNQEAGNRIAALQKLLQDKPANPEGELPFLPLENAKQMMHVKVQYVSFAGGQGVRYLTQYAQGMMPVNNQALFYTFQGLTEDGKYYVAAILPVSHPSLPASFDAVPADQLKVGEAYTTYLNDAAKALEGQDEASFQPSLADLDALVKSIEVKR